MEEVPAGTLRADEPHPSAWSALKWIKSLDVSSLIRWQEAYASCSLTGDNRLAEVCSETLHRLMNGQPVSDRYLLGLAWSMRYYDDIASGGSGNAEAVPEKKIRKTRKQPESEGESKAPRARRKKVSEAPVGRPTVRRKVR